MLNCTIVHVGALHMMQYGETQVDLECTQWNNFRLAQNTSSLTLHGGSVKWQLCGRKNPVLSASLRRAPTSLRSGNTLIQTESQATRCSVHGAPILGSQAGACSHQIKIVIVACFAHLATPLTA